MFDSLAHYRIEAEIGEGAFATVYRAYNTKLENTVALKVLKSFWMTDNNAVRRFLREAKTMAKLHHPNIVQIYDVDQSAGQLYLAEYLVDGTTLAKRIKAEKLAWKETLTILRPIVSALDYAHRRQLIHRDLKPENILISEEGEVFVSDFGLVYAAEGSASITASTGGMLGTASYMAPEQWRGGEPSPATDVYALTCILIEMLTGKPHIDAPSRDAAMVKHLVDRPPLPADWASDVPADLNRALEKGLALDPAERIQSARDLLAQLEKISAPKPTPKPQPARPQPETPKWLWAALAIAAAVIIMLAMALSNRPATDNGGLATTRAELAATQTAMAIAAAPTQTHTPMPTADRVPQATDTPAPKPSPTPNPVSPTSTATNTPVPPTKTATPTATRTPRPTATPTPFLIVNTAAMNIRSGPGTNYDVVGKANQDDTFAVTARTTAGDWLRLRGSDERWVYANLVQINGAVPVAQSIPPSPTPNPVPPGMVYVPAGEFTMGSDNSDSDEQPVHTVYLDGFYIDKYEVTNAQFAQFLNAKGNQSEGGATWLDAGDPDANIHQNGSTWQADAGYENHPVIEVTWYGAQAYCQWAGKQLPTEAQWEKAARGTNGRTYPWGEGIDCSKAQYYDCGGKTVPVGTKNGVSPYGAYDMAGNVWEWVSDWYDSNYYANSPTANPSGPATGQWRVLRGGSWSYYDSNLRAAHRYGFNPDLSYYFNGFRCVLVGSAHN